MNKVLDDFASFPSDILSPDDQDELFRNLQNNDVAAMNDILHDHNSQINDHNFNGGEDFKENFSNMLSNEQFIPIVPEVLSNREYSGPHEFDVFIEPNSATKNPWVYSSNLNKVFMDMLNPFPVDFKIKNRPPNTLLFIRVTPQYSQPQFCQECVYRCINHEHALDNTNKEVPENVRQHIIRCHNNTAIYLGDKYKNERLSVVIPFSLPQTGSDSVREMFQFVCKSSCPNPGMNRRPIEIIFTLEDSRGSVLGRKCLNVRICSCPKRDKEKEERESKEKSHNLPRGKKRKVEKPEKKVSSNENDLKEYMLNVKIIGKHNYQQVLKQISDIMAGEVLKYTGTSAELLFRKQLEDVNALREKNSD